MDKETYSKDKVATYINEHYYAVKFNAESRDSVNFGGKKYGFNTAAGANDLAVYLAFGQMAYPTTVFLSAVKDQPAPIPGFLSPSDLEAPLKYFGDGINKTKTYTEYMQTFQKSW
jgi:thioredoxin-related protein